MSEAGELPTEREIAPEDLWPPELEDQFPFIPGEKDFRPKPVEMGGRQMVVNDMGQTVTLRKDQPFLVVERGVSGCVVLRITEPETVSFFHIGANMVRSPRSYEGSLQERAFVYELGKAGGKDAKYDYYYSGFHAGEAERRRGVVRMMHAQLFPGVKELQVQEIRRTDSAETNDLRESVDLVFMDDAVKVSDGFLIASDVMRLD